MANKTISASELKAHCARVIEDVEKGRTEMTVTRRGRPVARIVPVTSEAPRLFGALSGSVTLRGDIVEPVDVSWEAGA